MLALIQTYLSFTLEIFFYVYIYLTCLLWFILVSSIFSWSELPEIVQLRWTFKEQGNGFIK